MTNYSYTSGLPAGSQAPAQQRSAMQTNNDNNALIWTVDHYGFNDNNGGTHQQVTFPLVAGSPPSPSSPEGVITTQSVGGVSQLFYTNSTSSIQLTGGNASVSTNGYTYLPGGVLMQWGKALYSSGLFITVNLNKTFPNNFFNATVTYFDSAGRDQETGVLLTGSLSNFRAYVGGVETGTGVYWIAIGN